MESTNVILKGLELEDYGETKQWTLNHENLDACMACGGSFKLSTGFYCRSRKLVICSECEQNDMYMRSCRSREKLETKENQTSHEHFKVLLKEIGKNYSENTRGKNYEKF